MSFNNLFIYFFNKFYIKDFDKLNNDFKIGEYKEIFPLIPIEAIEYFNDNKTEEEINDIINLEINNDKNVLFILLKLLKENEKDLNEFDDMNSNILNTNSKNIENENIVNEFNGNLNDDEDNYINIFKSE